MWFNEVVIVVFDLLLRERKLLGSIQYLEEEPENQKDSVHGVKSRREGRYKYAKAQFKLDQVRGILKPSIIENMY